jgi:hypothetical protein
MPSGTDLARQPSNRGGDVAAEPKEVMMNGYLIPAFAAALALTCASVYAREVNLAEHDRVELRQRADALRAENALGRTRGEGAREEIRGEAQVKHVKVKKKAKKRHVKRGRAHRRT